MALDATKSMQVRGVDWTNPITRGMILAAPLNPTGKFVQDFTGGNHGFITAGSLVTKYGRQAWETGWGFIAFLVPERLYRIRVNPHTYSFWFMKGGSLGYTDRFIYDNGYSATSGLHALRYNNKSLDGRIAFSTTSLVVSSSNVITALNTWYHVCVTWNGQSAASSLRLYVDGNETRSSETDGVGDPVIDQQNSFSNAGLRFGDRADAGRELHYGGPCWLSNINVWNRALSPDEVLSVRDYPESIYSYTPQMFSFPAAAGPTFNPAWAANCNRLVA